MVVITVYYAKNIDSKHSVKGIVRRLSMALGVLRVEAFHTALLRDTFCHDVYKPS